ncbi:Os09g0391400 [Oryza sativa Japonica Group]|uniref:Os09g0391400 protein n=1 Tax=Oryza sativa subsp. japonica TaxID=39947 RepID=A0A0P0XL65_ORYSJ|nr:Os09g0391400 [Oryza sativa Japonica Group]
MFTGSHGNTVDARLIPLAHQIAEGNIVPSAQFSWGSAVLAATYRGFCDACVKTGQREAIFTGCPLLVKLWSYEHFSFGHPYMSVAVAHKDDYADTVDDRPTFGTRWCYGPPQWARIQVHNVYKYFTETFESLRENEVRWTPYTNEEAILRGPNGGYNVQRVMRQMGLYQQVPVPVGLHLPPDVHTQADNRYRRSMHLRMTPWIEAWSQALNDVVHETRAYDHNTYEQYMAWYSSQTRIRLLAPEDPDERGPPTIEQIYDL